MFLNHITLVTGHLARSPRSDVAPEATRLLDPWLRSCINSGQTHPLPLPPLSHFSIGALLEDGALVVTVFAPLGPHQPGKPHVGGTTPLVTFGVAQRSPQGAQLWDTLARTFSVMEGLGPPETPYCAVAVHPGVMAFSGPTEWLGDFERCVAWTWLTRNPDLRPG